MIFDIQAFGAVGDGKTVNTAAIQKAIDEAAIHGGQVRIADGIYKTGSLRLRSNVDFHIAAGAVLLGSEDPNDYLRFEEITHCNYQMAPRRSNACLIMMHECENASITGLGTIDCNGEHFVEPIENGDVLPCAYRRIDGFTPPRVVFCVGSSNIKIENVTMTNQPAGWSYWIHDCDYVSVRGIRIYADVRYPNNDGVHINCSRHVTVSDCNITCSDDCIVLRANSATLAENKPCEQVTVTNCNLQSYSACVRIGWVNDGHIRDITLSNLTMKDSAVGVSLYIPGLKRDEKTTDVGRESTVVENLLFSNVIMDRIAGYPVYIHVADREFVTVSAIRDIRFSAVRCTAAQLPFIKGRKDLPIQKITFSDCSFQQIPNDFCYARPCRGYTMTPKYTYDPQPFTLQYCENIVFANTDFSVAE